MIFLWTKSDLIGSKIIRWGTGEESSHFAVCFFEQAGDSSPLLESRLGHTVGIDFLGDFLDRNKVVHALRVSFEKKGHQLQLFRQCGDALRGKYYDDWGILYWSYRILRKKIFGDEIPTANEWGKNNRFYCVEVLDALREFLSEIDIDLDEVDLEMTTPEMAYSILVESPALTDVTRWFTDVDEKYKGG